MEITVIKFNMDTLNILVTSRTSWTSQASRPTDTLQTTGIIALKTFMNIKVT
jgi:hypothetical protein